ncbi:AraC family transcriptional regulator [Acinetobacter bereziniae]|uniref:AraC family transcriptional regulator n=1 Tax=Acinetobacter bereziniae TaxID=106648 RepID=UPI0019020E0E|nr:helix-turn-helix transcriptional regulator [Acinetobacter bereziniae]MBJ8552504.1 helix-turn-helix transcriptional regulator [Acinetobacter bereziniae]
MRNIRVSDVEDTARIVMATGNDYPDGTILPCHSHKRGQCLYAITGVLTVNTDIGSWVVPPRRALWIPNGIQHEVHMRGITKTRSAYIVPEVAKKAGLLEYCAVINVSPLLHELLSAAIDIPVEYELDGRDDYLMQLMIKEIAIMPELPLNAPLPQEARLSALCLEILKAPSLDKDLDQIAKQVGMSRRHFTRIFRLQTGMSFSHWRQQACLLNALMRMELGQPITHVAMELGYSSSSAFTAAFKRSLGLAPSFYLQGKNSE